MNTKIRTISKKRHYTTVRNVVVVIYDRAICWIGWQGDYVEDFYYQRFASRSLSSRALDGYLRGFLRCKKSAKKRNVKESYGFGIYCICRCTDPQTIVDVMYSSLACSPLEEVLVNDDYTRMGGDATLGAAVEEMVSEVRTRLNLGGESTGEYDTALRDAVRVSISIGIALADADA